MCEWILNDTTVKLNQVAVQLFVGKGSVQGCDHYHFYNGSFLEISHNILLSWSDRFTVLKINISNIISEHRNKRL